ncbi:fibronectin type III domain-containing protein [Brevibacillus humidisoli]|uniref:fibronectin type III domain-containing protein n=1 Tax=Brevibacillus humidisoli TaxID=2895522 RepID=UPI001E62B578|nr:fibronectin type III domain-containing protein [Brevibacillus humidisoli]UFJ41426.1 fibronectin type III domain-containing protein [Brevibacillus humidisoli]
MLKRCMSLFVLLFLLIHAHSAYGAAKDEPFEVVKKISRQHHTYSVVMDVETEEYFLRKEEREKGEETLVYETSLGRYEGKVKVKLSVREESLILFISTRDDFSLIQADEVSGEVMKEISIDDLGIQKNKGNRELNTASERDVSANLRSMTVPEAPSFVATEEMTPTTIDLKWNEVAGAEEYRVYFADLSEEEPNELLVETTETTATLQLPSSTVYQFYLRTVNDSRESDPYYFIALLPDKFQQVEAVSGMDNLHFEWSPVEGVDDYKLYFYSEEEKEDELRTEDTSYTFENLEPLAIHILNNDAISGTEILDEFALVTMTYPLVPQEPDDFNAEVLPDASLRLEWEESDYAAEYVLYQEDEEIATLGSLQTSYIVHGLQIGETYDFYLKARNISGESDRVHVEVTITPPDIPDPPLHEGDLPAPENFVAEEILSESVLLRWDPIPEAIRYDLWINGEKSGCGIHDGIRARRSGTQYRIRTSPKGDWP